MTSCSIGHSRNTAAFTLIEIIGVLAIMSILSAMIAPAVIKSIRESKITSALTAISAARIAAANFNQRYGYIPVDADITLVYNYKVDPTGTPPITYTPLIGGFDFGDILVYQSQLLEQEATRVGRSTATLTHAIGSCLVGDAMIGGAIYTGSVSEMHFKSSGAAVQIVYYFMPNLTIKEAATMAIKINGPFSRDALAELDFIEATLAGQGINSVGELEGANAWFSPGDDPGEYHAYIYVSHR